MAQDPNQLTDPQSARAENSGAVAPHSQRSRGKARTAVLLWLLGVPIPLILLFLLIRSCM